MFSNEISTLIFVHESLIIQYHKNNAYLLREFGGQNHLIFLKKDLIFDPLTPPWTIR